MRLICFWCFLVAASVRAQDGYYAPQTFNQNNVGNAGFFQPAHRSWEPSVSDTRWTKVDKGLFTPSRNDVSPQSTIAEPWRPKPVQENWNAGPSYSAPAPVEPWRPPFQLTKEQQAAIIHHKQALTSEGSFQFEYASDNGLAAGETIQPDGSRIGGYQYKDPSGQIVKLKYKAGKEGFQILEGSHIPKSPEPVPPLNQEAHHQQAYEQQRQAYELQQQYNQQRPEPNRWNNPQYQEGPRPAAPSNQYYAPSWQRGNEDDGQYRENGVEDRGPHNFGEGYSFAFKG
ncbi:uncharacterized protein LOC135086099 isoform X2 [Ostrinia nubilalis]|uniref:uncharacterized protein LOC135086099 isoform X2 n=1 Tax=Ostrinia nubilalis TaxID=29057 RepID=UPI00308268A7